jgi:hypothetical protein
LKIRLDKIIPGLDIPDEFWNLSYDTQKSIIEDLEIKKESGMRVAQRYLDFLDLIKVSPKFESMGPEDSDKHEPIPKNFAEAERIEKQEEKPN